MLTPLGISPSFGFGDRLGLATPGHIAALQNSSLNIHPIFAQQSVRENARTGRSPQEVIDDAKRYVEAAGWEKPWGADADHLKSVNDLLPFIKAGYTFYTVDPGTFVDNAADTDPISVLWDKAKGYDWDLMSDFYLSDQVNIANLYFDSDSLVKAIVKYGKAIQHAVEIYQRLVDLLDIFDFEISVDETDSPTTPFEHFFIASELRRSGVSFTSLAPRFSGQFEKGVDFIGDLDALDKEFAQHAAVTAHFGNYKISLHSGSDKFSVYPYLVKHWHDQIHVKTAGTSYLEALRSLAVTSPDLFNRIWLLGLEHYPNDRITYHVSADPMLVQSDLPLPALLDNFHAREILHVTFGSALSHFGIEIKTELEKHKDVYNRNLKTHFGKHLSFLNPGLKL